MRLKECVLLVAATLLSAAGTAAAEDSAVDAAKFCVTPYLQHPATNAMSILFFTDRACEAKVSAWLANGTAGPTAANPLVIETRGEWASALTNNTAIGIEYDDSVWTNSLYRHRARFEGLELNRLYRYVVDLGGVVYTNAFRTAPDRNTPVRFVSYGDCETEANPWTNYVHNLRQMKTRDPDFFALAGDLAARGGIQSHWDGFWKANAGTETDVAGSIPILTAIGNHDLFDNSRPGDKVERCWMYDMQGEPSTDRFITYFEVESNGVDFASAPMPDTETRDMSQLFHRVDYGPVTLIFLDTNNGRDGDTDDDHDHDTNYMNRNDGMHLLGGLDRRLGCRHPDFNVGTPQYVWLTNNLADAQAKSRFTFVLNHHCPYSQGSHNRDWRSGEDGSVLALRFLTETFVRYGVDGWLCGHDEILEHSITNGWEILPDGNRRKHTLSIYDLGCSGDTFRNSNSVVNPLKYYVMTKQGYGFIETDVTTNRNGRWTCTITPFDASGDTCTAYPDQFVLVENASRDEDADDAVYAQHRDGNDLTKGFAAGIPSKRPANWVAWEKPPEGPGTEAVITPEEPPEIPVDATQFVYAGCTVTVSKAVSVTSVGDELVLTFSQDGSLRLSHEVRADILVVGGGGGGGGAYYKSNFFGGTKYAGNGGNGGEVRYAENRIIPAKAELSVCVGTGGVGGGGVASGATAMNGEDGGDSYVSGAGFETVFANRGGGGTGGARTSNGKAGNAGTGSAKFVISGNPFEYGAAGEKASSSSAASDVTVANGQGGQGGLAADDQTQRMGGKGGDGIVIVRLKEVLIPREPIERPIAAEGLVFDGTVQTGVAASAQYAIDGVCMARDAGTYQATVTPTVGWCWPDGTWEAVSLVWSIARRPVTVRAAATSKVVGEEEPVYRTVDEGFVDGDDVEVSWTVWRTNLVELADGTLGLDETVGVYDLCVTGEVELANYVIEYVNGIGAFEILKAAPSISDAAGRIDYDPGTRRATVTPEEGTNAVSIADLPREATVVVPARLDTVKGVDPGQLVVISSPQSAGSPTCDITGAFKIEGNRIDGVNIVLSDDPNAAVTVSVGDRLETIRVTPELTNAGDENVEPLKVTDGEVGLGAKTIPGLRYLLRRSQEPAGAAKGDVVDSKRAETTRTKLTDTTTGERPDRAFYVIEVTK